VPVNKEAVSI